jgi:hypothetical protein
MFIYISKSKNDINKENRGKINILNDLIGFCLITRGIIFTFLKVGVGKSSLP